MTVYTESETTELKTRFTDTICRDIVAFLNTNGGDIIIGVDDSGQVVGVKNIDETSKKISDIITDQIEPNPQSMIHSEIRYEDGKALLIIHIQKGIRPLYCQKKYGYSSVGCLVRIGTTCRNMTSEQIHFRYEKNFTESDLMIITPAKYQSISFKTLKILYSERGYHLGNSSFEANLNLQTPDGRYNLLAELLSDKNMIPLIVVKFKGTDKSSVSERNDYGSQCLLFGYEQIKNRLAAENICISDTTVRPRKDKYLFNFDCVNEAVINALVHNDWNISQPLISLFNDRLEILSHGGLPKGQTKELFFKGISKPRNDMLMRIFLNMELTEHTGHGVPTILSKYGESAFDIGDSYINVIIPYDRQVLKVIGENKSIEASSELNGGLNGGLNDGLNGGLNAIEKDIIRHLKQNPSLSVARLAEEIGVSQRTAERTLKNLREKGFIIREGSRKKGNWTILKQI